MRTREAKEQTLIEKFLIQLEALALEKEARIASLKEKRKQCQYFQDLMDVLTKSRIGFAEDFEEGRTSQKEEFKKYLNELVDDSSKREAILSEIKNISFLSKQGIINHEEVRAQKETAMKTLDFLIIALREFLEKHPLASTERKIDYLESYLQKIVTLGSCYEDYLEPHEIADIDFFHEVIEKVILSDSEKLTLITYTLENNVKNYQEELQSQDLMLREDFDEQKEKEKTPLEEGLEERRPEKKEKFVFEDMDALLEEVLKAEEASTEKPKYHK